MDYQKILARLAQPPPPPPNHPQFPLKHKIIQETL